MVEFLTDCGIEGATVLEVGGGAGEIQVELLKRGAAGPVNLELSSAYEAEAGELLRTAGLDGQAGRRLHDIAVDPDGVEAAYVVVLHRVVCCYPDYQRLLAAAGFQLPALQRGHQAGPGRAEPRLHAAGQAVPGVRPSTGQDARGAAGRRVAADTRPPQADMAGGRA